MDTNNRTEAARYRSRGLAILALVVGVVTCLATAVSAVGVRDAPDEHTGGPVTERVVVAEGERAGTIGRWRLWRSTDASGHECIEVQLLDEPGADVPDSVRVPGALPVPGGGSLSGGCGNPARTYAASISSPSDTLVYGRVPQQATRAKLKALGHHDRDLQLTAGPRGVPHMFYGAVLPSGKLKDVRVEAAGPDDALLGEADLPVAGGE